MISFFRWVIPAGTAQLDNYYASILDVQTGACTSDSRHASFSDSDAGEDSIEDVQPPAPASLPMKEITEILKRSMRAVSQISHKSFSPANKVSVKFTNDAGVSEGAVDLGGPMREFFTLVLQYLHDSQLFCGRDSSKFISFQSKCLVDDNYYYAGIITAMSIVHGRPGPKFFSPVMFQALISDLSKVTVSIEDVYDYELQ